MRDLAELNLNEGGEPVDKAPPSPETIAAFETAFDVKLPADYLQFLSYSNGGCPELDFVQPVEDEDCEPWGINRFFHLDDDREAVEGLWWQTQAWRAVLGEKRVPIAGDGGGDVVFLDMSSAPAKVLGCRHEEDFEVIEIAESFEQFIDNLELDPELEFDEEDD